MLGCIGMPDILLNICIYLDMLDTLRYITIYFDIGYIRTYLYVWIQLDIWTYLNIWIRILGYSWVLEYILLLRYILICGYLGILGDIKYWTEILGRMNEN